MFIYMYYINIIILWEKIYVVTHKNWPINFYWLTYTSVGRVQTSLLDG